MGVYLHDMIVEQSSLSTNLRNNISTTSVFKTDKVLLIYTYILHICTRQLKDYYY